MLLHSSESQDTDARGDRHQHTKVAPAADSSDGRVGGTGEEEES